MIRLRYLTLLVLAVLIVVSTVPLVSSDVLRGEFTIPNWVKNTAGWWASDQIPDSAFLQGIQFLIKEKIIIVKISAVDSEVVEEVPGWVKNTAGWWAEDKIHDIAFVNAIKYLISQGIVYVEREQVEEPVEEVVEIKDFYMEVNGGDCCLNWAYVNEEYRFEIETFDKKHGNQIDGVTITAKIISKGGELRQNLGAVTTEDGIYKNSITIPSLDWYAGNILSVTGTYYDVEKTIEKEFEVFYKKSDDGGIWQVRYMQAVDDETDGVNGFTELRGAHGVDTFTIGSSTYAIVASQPDKGVQIIDISDPTAIVAKDAETDGANGFTMLYGAWGVDTFTIGSSTYAIVTSYIDGVQIIDISDPTAIVAKDAETDGVNGFTMLDKAHGVDTFTIGSSTYAIVASQEDNGVQIIDISDPTAIVAKDAEEDGVNGFTELEGPEDVNIFTCGSRTYAMVVSATDSGVQMIDISDPANIVALDAATDGVNGFTVLEAVYNVETFKIGSNTYAIATSYNDDGVQMIEMPCRHS